MLTVCICTYNRAASLRGALSSLEQAAAGFSAPWRLLVVDNNSSDGTKAVCAEFARRLPLRYVHEPEQGLSFARNRALREVDCGVLVFTDDDVEFDPAWLREYAKAVADWPDAAFYGGRLLPRWPRRRPTWLVDESLALIAGLLVRYELGERNRPYAANEPTPYGASFALSTDWAAKVGWFRLDLGVKGDVAGRGEEVDYIERLIAIGGCGVYVGRALAWHVQDEARFELPYLYQYGVQKGIALRRIDPRASSGNLAAEAWFGLRGLLQLMRGRGDRFRQCVILMGMQRGLRQG